MFDDQKMLQVIGHLLSLNNNRMNKLKLMKELYLIDRESIKERDTSVSGDDFFSLQHGPILSKTLNLINDIPNDNAWAKYLLLDGYDIVLKSPTGTGELSIKDKEYINTIATQYINYTQYELRDFTHTLPEWQKYKQLNQKLKFSDIMRGLGKSEEEINATKEEYDSIKSLYESLGVR